MIITIIYKIKAKRFCLPRLKEQGLLIVKSHTELFMPNVISYKYLLN